MRSILYPDFSHSAIEERYGAWQSQLFLRRAAEWTEWITYEPDAAVGAVVAAVSSPECVVVTDPLLLAPQTIVDSLASAFTSSVVAAVPVTNETENEHQRTSPREPYLTIRQFESLAAEYARRSHRPAEISWRGDPGLFLCRTEYLRQCNRPAREALSGAPVAVVSSAYVHRWTRLRSQPRIDLLEYIPPDATNILEFGCAEGLLGEAVKRRQYSRYVGIELDESAAAAARRRLDQVYCGDATQLISAIDETFDCIIGGDVLEHLPDPWTFLSRLRCLAAPEASLVLSVPNIANAAIVADLLQNRFDYAYIAIACAGHMRFFTRHTIADALEIAGWRTVSIARQPAIENDETLRVSRILGMSGLVAPGDDLSAPGFYVVARNTSATSRMRPSSEAAAAGDQHSNSMDFG